MSKRRRARENVLKSLYAIELSGNPVDTVIDDVVLQTEGDKDIVDFAIKLIKKSIDHRKEFDEIIKKKLLNWDIDRVALLDKILLRQSICEFLYFKDIPPKVTINEAVELAKKFSTKKSGQFVNGLLDSILKDLKKEGKISKKGRGLRESN
ncbi:transcription antitermination factor NusB [candidate division KSB1 bacterium]|nr:MAG: transcription antitermination factor NusB [candidate division KSB1 bacterium]